jgi:hypothetical protein
MTNTTFLSVPPVAMAMSVRRELREAGKMKELVEGLELIICNWVAFW